LFVRHIGPGSILGRGLFFDWRQPIRTRLANAVFAGRGITSGVPVQRGYRDASGLAHALDLVGERWALLVIRELLLGPKRFSDLRRGLPAASPNAIAGRLRELVAAGIVGHHSLPVPAGIQVYQLTSWGRELESIVVALDEWASTGPAVEPAGFLSVDALMLMIRSHYRGRESHRSAVVEVRLGDQPVGRDRFSVHLDGASAEPRHAISAHPDATIQAPTAMTVANACGDRGRVEQALAADLITLDGNRLIATWLLSQVRPRPSDTPDERPG
jgi:DNA-binding HxlR family transcriptional regulator